MSTLSIPKQYAAGQVLQKSHLDAIVTSVETYLNNTGVQSENIQIDSVLNSLTSTHADNILADAGWGDLTTATLNSTSTVTSVATTFVTATPPSAGKYLVCAGAILSPVGTTALQGGIYTETITITCDLVYGASNTVIQTGGVSAGSSSEGHSIQNGQINNVSFLSVVTLGASDTVSLLVVNSFGLATGVTTDIRAGSFIQLYRLKDA